MFVVWCIYKYWERLIRWLGCCILEIKRRKKNYLVLDWSIDSLEDRYKYLEESGILEDLSDRRKSRLAKAQLNMITTYLFRSKDIESGRKVDESYYIDDSSYYRSLKTSTYVDDIDEIADDEEHVGDNNHIDEDNSKDDKEKDIELDSDLGYDKHDDIDRYISGIEDEQDDYYERLLHIENLFDPKNIDNTVLRRIVTTYRDIKDVEFDSDIVKYNVEKIMESVLMCVDNDDDNKVIELLMQDMTEHEISNVMNVSQQSVNKRIKKIFRKTIKLLNN